MGKTDKRFRKLKTIKKIITNKREYPVINSDRPKSESVLNAKYNIKTYKSTEPIINNVFILENSLNNPLITTLLFFAGITDPNHYNSGSLLFVTHHAGMTSHKQAHQFDPDKDHT